MTLPTLTQAVLPATWFDGRNSRRHAVQIWPEQDVLVVAPMGANPAPPRRYALTALRLDQDLPGRERPLDLPDGSRLWLPQRSAELIAPRLPAARPGLGERLSARWSRALACLCCLIALLVWLDRQGVGLAAQAVLSLLPRTVDLKVGEQVEQVLSRELQASTQSMERQRRLRARFTEAAARLEPNLNVKLEFKRSNSEGWNFNAFALPHGGVVVMDGLAEKLSDDELMAVLGHELGHVVHRHGMQGLLRSFGLLSVAGVVLADFSSVAAGSVATVQRLRYSRDAEREADAYARRLIAELGLPPQTLAAVWLKFKANKRIAAADKAQPDWLSSHPSLDERLSTETSARP